MSRQYLSARSGGRNQLVIGGTIKKVFSWLNLIICSFLTIPIYLCQYLNQIPPSETTKSLLRESPAARRSSRRRSLPSGDAGVPTVDFGQVLAPKPLPMPRPGQTAAPPTPGSTRRRTRKRRRKALKKRETDSEDGRPAASARPAGKRPQRQSADGMRS